MIVIEIYKTGYISSNRHVECTKHFKEIVNSILPDNKSVADIISIYLCNDLVKIVCDYNKNSNIILPKWDPTPTHFLSCAMY